MTKRSKDKEQQQIRSIVPVNTSVISIACYFVGLPGRTFPWRINLKGKRASWDDNVFFPRAGVGVVVVVVGIDDGGQTKHGK